MVGFEEKTRHAEGGTRHTLFAGVRLCPFCAWNGSFLSVACCYVSLKFVGVAVQANAVQQCLSNEWKQESYYKETILEREQTERLVYL